VAAQAGVSAPRYSVLVPTRERPATLVHTLATVAGTGRDDCEIVVADNASGPETRRVVDGFASPRLRYTRSETVIPMAENWERGLALCSGEYITVLGDDDGFLPSTLAAADRLIATTGAEVITWQPQVYWWPDTIVPWNRSRLYLRFGDDAVWVESRQALEQFYAGTIGFGMIPMIYSSFFHRRIIEEARRRHGGFFVPPDTPPDVSSGILGLHLSSRFVHSNRALTLRGNSSTSNGTAQWMRSLGAGQREVYYREERVGMHGMVHESLVPSPNLHILIASAKVKCRERYFPGDAALRVDLGGVVAAMLGSLNHDPDAYEENLRDARALAAKIGIAIAPGDIPPRKPARWSGKWGPMRDRDGTIAGVCVNCDLAGVSDVAAAARLAESLMPPVKAFLEREEVGELAPARQAFSYADTRGSRAPQAFPFLRRLLAGLVRRR
jgi:glycosyltransferase involved in cell wall biosynthesis